MKDLKRGINMATITKIDEINLKNSVQDNYKFGYKVLDNCLNGIKDGSIITIGARPGMGKTTFLNDIIMNLLEKYNLPILYVSLEMNKSNLALALASIGKEENYRDVFHDELKMTEYIQRLKQKKYNLFVSDDCYTISDLENLIEQNQEIKFLAIDYIQLLRNEKESTSALDKYNDTLDRIKALAKKYNLVILLLSQLSRNVEYREYKRPRIIDLKQSGNLEDISDIVLLLYRDSYYDKEINSITTEIIVAKNRHGKVGNIISLDYDTKTSKFIDY